MSLGDITASLFTAIGINAALYHREKTGLGQKIDVSMLDSQVAILENALVRYQSDGESPQPLGNRHPTISPFQAYHASDIWFVIAVGNDNLWKSFCVALGKPELLDDLSFSTNRLRTENIGPLNSILEPVLASKTAAEWLKIMDKAGIPCAPINDIEAVMNDPQILFRNMIVEVEDKLAGTIKIAGNPIKMSSVTESPTRDKVPEIGEHNQEIYGALLGFSEAETNELHVAGVI